jgi:hypothetical protein
VHCEIHTPCNILRHAWSAFGQLPPLDASGKQPPERLLYSGTSRKTNSHNSANAVIVHARDDRLVRDLNWSFDTPSSERILNLFATPLPAPRNELNVSKYLETHQFDSSQV